MGYLNGIEAYKLMKKYESLISQMDKAINNELSKYWAMNALDPDRAGQWNLYRSMQQDRRLLAQNLSEIGSKLSNIYIEI